MTKPLGKRVKLLLAALGCCFDAADRRALLQACLNVGCQIDEGVTRMLSYFPVVEV